jgi:putative DNA primase/helicase
MEEQYGPLPATVEVLTGGGGRHFHFQNFDGIGCSNGELAPGVDVKAEGGYVILPPSPNESGRRYAWLDESRPVLALPPWLAELLDGLKKKLKQRIPAFDGPKIPRGQHDIELTRIAGKLRGIGMEQQALEVALIEIVEKRFEDYGPDYKQMCAKHARGAMKWTVTEAPSSGSQHSDAANCVRFSEQHSDNLKYIADLKEWRHYNGKVWAEEDATGQPMRCAMKTALSIFDEISSQPTQEKRDGRAKWAVASEQRARLEAMVALARSSPGIRVKHYRTVFDRHPDLLACENGVIDLRTGALEAHRRELMLTQFAPVRFSPEATCPWFDGFLRDAFENDEEMIAYLDHVLGYSLTGHTRERAIFLMLGEGRNGKSTLAELVKFILGSAAGKASFQTFTQASYQRSGSDAEPDIVALHDKRVVWAVESERRRKLDTAKLKEHSGEDSIKARTLHAKPIEFKPQYKIFLIANESPGIAGDPALWDRIHHIEFKVRIPDEKLVEDFLHVKLLPELEGIFARIVRGSVAWYEKGLKPPKRATDSTKKLRKEVSNPVFEWWFDKRAILNTNKETRLTLVAKDFEEFARKLEHKDPPGRRALGEWLRREKNLTQREDSHDGIVYLKGICLR